MHPPTHTGTESKLAAALGLSWGWGLKVWGLAWGLGFGLGLGVWASFGVWGSGFWCKVLGFRVCGLGREGQ